MKTAPPLTVLAEGHRWVAVNKPAGIATEKHYQYDTVEARALRQFRRPRSLKDPYVGIVHRLDRVTSGVLLLARNKRTLVALNEAFASRTVEKTYWAITDRPLPQREGQLKHFLIKNRMGRKAIASNRPLPGGNAAELSYRLLKTEKERFFWELKPVSGRFHQLRVQLSAVECPIVGDSSYGSGSLIAPNVIALHARSLRFTDPETKKKVTVEAPLPDYFDS